MSMTTEELLSLVDKLRSAGVTRYLHDGLELELRPLEPTLPTEKSKPEDAPDMCKCGHALYMHMDGLCTQACEPNKCAVKIDPE